MASSRQPDDGARAAQFARNFAAAFIATQQGIGLDYARKKYGDGPIGEFWTSLARMVIDHLANQTALPPRIPPTIQ